MNPPQGGWGAWAGRQLCALRGITSTRRADLLIYMYIYGSIGPGPRSWRRVILHRGKCMKTNFAKQNTKKFRAKKRFWHFQKNKTFERRGIRIFHLEISKIKNKKVNVKKNRIFHLEISKILRAKNKRERHETNEMFFHRGASRDTWMLHRIFLINCDGRKIFP